MQPTPWGFFLFSFSVPIRPLAVSCVPSDPECSRPPGALSPGSTFFSDRGARDGTRQHPPHQKVNQSLSSTVNPFARGQPGCAMRTARVRGIRLPPTTSMSSLRATSTVPTSSPHVIPTAPMSSSRATPNRSHVVFPRYPPTTPMSSPRATPNHFHVVFPRCLQPLPCRLPMSSLAPSLGSPKSTTPMSPPHHKAALFD